MNKTLATLPGVAEAIEEHREEWFGKAVRTTQLIFNSFSHMWVAHDQV
jgi:hypothetical protein